MKLRALVAGTVLWILMGCGADKAPAVVEEQGVIQPGDATDYHYGDQVYDQYDFQVSSLSTVTVEVEADGFLPMLVLVEDATGAVISEWDSRYSEGSCLTHRIPASGVYQARVYAAGNGTGSYTVSITVDPR